MNYDKSTDLNAVSLQEPTGIDADKIHLRRSPFPSPTHLSAAGFAANAATQSSLEPDEQRQMAALVQTVLQDPLLQRKLCDRVYEFMLEEARQIREISSPHR